MWHQQKYSKSKENNESTKKKKVNVGKNPFNEELMVRYIKKQVD